MNSVTPMSQADATPSFDNAATHQLMRSPGETGFTEMRILSAAIMICTALLSPLPALADAIGTAKNPVRVMLIPADGGTEDGTKADFQPLFDAITRSSGLHFTVSTGQSYAAVIEGMCAGLTDIAWFGPASYIEARERGCAELLAVEERNGASTYYAGLFVAADSDFQDASDLTGHAVALGSSHSASSFSYPLALLRKENVDPLNDLAGIRITGSHTNSLLALKNGHADAAGASFVSFERAVNQGNLDPRAFRILARSAPIPNPPIAMHTGLPEDTKARLRLAMSQVHNAAGVNPDAIRGYGGKRVDRYNTEAGEALFDSVIEATSFLTDDYMAALLRKAVSDQRG